MFLLKDCFFFCYTCDSSKLTLLPPPLSSPNPKHPTAICCFGKNIWNNPIGKDVAEWGKCVLGTEKFLILMGNLKSTLPVNGLLIAYKKLVLPRCIVLYKVIGSVTKINK